MLDVGPSSRLSCGSPFHPADNLLLLNRIGLTCGEGSLNTRDLGVSGGVCSLLGVLDLGVGHNTGSLGSRDCLGRVVLAAGVSLLAFDGL